MKMTSLSCKFGAILSYLVFCASTTHIQNVHQMLW